MAFGSSASLPGSGSDCSGQGEVLPCWAAQLPKGSRTLTAFAASSVLRERPVTGIDGARGDGDTCGCGIKDGAIGDAAADTPSVRRGARLSGDEIGQVGVAAVAFQKLRDGSR